MKLRILLTHPALHPPALSILKRLDHFKIIIQIVYHSQLQLKWRGLWYTEGFCRDLDHTYLWFSSELTDISSFSSQLCCFSSIVDSNFNTNDIFSDRLKLHKCVLLWMCLNWAWVSRFSHNNNVNVNWLKKLHMQNVAWRRLASTILLL